MGKQAAYHVEQEVILLLQGRQYAQIVRLDSRVQQAQAHFLAADVLRAIIQARERFVFLVHPEQVGQLLLLVSRAAPIVSQATTLLGVVNA